MVLSIRDAHTSQGGHILIAVCLNTGQKIWQILFGDYKLEDIFIGDSLKTIPMKYPFYRLQGRYIPLIIESVIFENDKKLIVIDTEQGKIINESKAKLLSNIEFLMNDIIVIKGNYYINMPEGSLLIFNAHTGEFCHAYKITHTIDGKTFTISDFSCLDIDRWHEKILDNILYLKSPLVVDLESGNILYKEKEGYMVEDVLGQVLTEWGL